MKPKPMKPVKAWAYVDKQTGKIDSIAKIGWDKKDAEAYRLQDERVARVVITEVVK